jgi:hypothetical protein
MENFNFPIAIFLYQPSEQVNHKEIGNIAFKIKILGALSVGGQRSDFWLLASDF